MTKPKAEYIPDKDLLYRRILNTHVNTQNGRIKAGAFGWKTEAGLSVEWAKYVINPKETRDRMTTKSCPKIKRIKASESKKFGVLSILTKDVRSIELDVIHTPNWNIAHTSIRNSKRLEDFDILEVRRELANKSSLLLKPSE